MLAFDRAPVILAGARKSSVRQIYLKPNGIWGDGMLPWQLPLLARGRRNAGLGAFFLIPYGCTSQVQDAVWKGGEGTFATSKSI